MNWCQPHWARLRKAITDRGLDHLGAKDGEQAAANIAAIADGLPEEFDPLMGCWMRINAYMAESPGCRGRFLECPLCILVNDGQPQTVDDWVDGCADQALEHAVKLGLVHTQ